ncbi:MAG: glycine cleavage system H [Rhodospirillaceae bacterium]|nr:MAG: glycine cleavage system H [Rhodospirillaceae bacterium]TNC94723.1 MAG: glycine cleavage system H protein [Stygiobacter sp.]
MSMYFTKDHEWIKVEGDTGTVGITEYAQHALGDIVYVEVPEKGRALKQGGDAAVVESVKAASEVYSPVSGTVIAGNDVLAGQPALVNESPEDQAWFFTLTLANPAELEALMDRPAYDEYVAGLE